MSQVVEIYSENSFECAEFEFELLIYKFRVEVSETADVSSHPVRYQLNSQQISLKFAKKFS